MAAALAPPPAPAMEGPPGRGLLPGLSPPPGGGRAAGEPDLAAEPLWGPRQRGLGRTPRPPTYSLPPSPAGRRGLDELSRSLAWQLGGPAPAGQREEEEAAVSEPCPPAGRQQGQLVEEGTPSRPAGTGLKFGLLPPELHARLLDQEDYKNRTQAVEELKRVVGGASQATVTSMPASSLLELLSLLCILLDDSNFKVVLGALEVIHLLALRLGDHVQGFLTPLVSAAAKVLGDNKLAIRQEYSRLFLQLMKAAGPQQVLALLLLQQFLRHKNSRVREEVVNICIVALLTYPSEEMDLAKLAFGLAPALVDSKPRVRHAAMEAFAVLASSMGPGKTPLLFKAVDTVELEDNGDGVMHAVQARLARKTLPRLVDQGFVEYGVPLPSPGHSRGSRFPPGADTDWLLMGSRTRSAHSYLGCPPRDDALQSSSSHGACAEQGLSPRRVLSAVPTYRMEPVTPLGILSLVLNIMCGALNLIRGVHLAEYSFQEDHEGFGNVIAFLLLFLACVFQCYLYLFYSWARKVKTFVLFLSVCLCNIYLYGLRNPWQIGFHIGVASLSSYQILTRQLLEKQPDYGV